MASDQLICVPDVLSKKLLSQHKRLTQLLCKWMGSFDQGMFIFFSSCSLYLGLQENQNVICVVLLIAQDCPPVPYTFIWVLDEEFQGYSMQTALTSKQKLVKTGGYTGKVYIKTKIFLTKESSTLTEGRASPHHYLSFQISNPVPYNLTSTQIRDEESPLKSFVSGQ